MKKISLALLILFSIISNAQEKKKKINIVYSGEYNQNEEKYPGASIFSRDDRQVQFEHEGIDLWCDLAVFYQKENLLKAFGNVFLQQGDTIQMNSGYIEYDGNTKLALAKEDVVLQNPDMTLTTDTLYFDRKKQEAYYNSFGTIKDTTNVLTSKKGRYFLTLKKYQFRNDVTLNNPEAQLHSLRLDYYPTTKHAYMFGPSTIIGKDYTIYCERGFYKTEQEEGYFVKNSRVDYNNRIINGDSLYFHKAKNFASATNNIKITDTINKGIVKGHYAEVFKEKDSVFITKRAVAVNLVEKDSIYIHGDTLMVTGKPEHRIIRAFREARFYKSDLSGKCDSIHSDQKTGITQLITRPILWSGKTQMTGDSINLLSNPETEKLDSLHVWDNSFVVQKDTLTASGYNQIKGKELLGYFEDNELRVVDIIKNAESIYYTRNDKNELIGIDKHVSGNLQFTLENNEIQDISYFINPDAVLYPESDLPENARKLRGFVWYGDEMIRSKDDIFDEKDNNIELVKIRGIDNPIDIQAEEEEYRRAMDSVHQSLPPRNPVPPPAKVTDSISAEDKDTTNTAQKERDTIPGKENRDSLDTRKPVRQAMDSISTGISRDSITPLQKTDSISPRPKEENTSGNSKSEVKSQQ
ncbi:OstA-like protein [Sinomicrobium sp. FJxs]|uniref:OstA-like protein n=1 Tax=Sinomicrobium weinanense TaxID=2842200 RepID=A0A926JR05_9FLAO|nr:OstA-like protein [Sinomicrobium weinanense]MBC9795693.1 OstA-like protein [Sinomicrobium weinanense]MBU3122862.1 OstA-like protein [Sinomicrobium weinanense]